MAGNILLQLLFFGYLGQSTARSFRLPGLFQRDVCDPNSPKVVVSVVEEVTVYPVYVSTYCTETTTLIVNEGLTISVTKVPTQIITSGVVTTTCTSTKTVYPGPKS